MSPHPTDAQLLHAWRNGDERAGNALYHRVFDTLLRFFAPRARDATDDLIQVTMQSVLELHERLQDSCSFRAFVLGIARYKLLHHYRSKRDRQRRDAGELASVVDPRTGASEIFRRRRTHQALAQALLSLPLDQQLLIELSYWEGLSSTEVGEILDIPASTVRGRRRAAERALRGAMSHPTRGGSHEDPGGCFARPRPGATQPRPPSRASATSPWPRPAEASSTRPPAHR